MTSWKLSYKIFLKIDNFWLITSLILILLEWRLTFSFGQCSGRSHQFKKKTRSRYLKKKCTCSSGRLFLIHSLLLMAHTYICLVFTEIYWMAWKSFFNFLKIWAPFTFCLKKITSDIRYISHIKNMNVNAINVRYSWTSRRSFRTLIFVRFHIKLKIINNLISKSVLKVFYKCCSIGMSVSFYNI